MLKIDREKLISLLTDFYRLTGIKICVCDEEGNEISYVPEHLCAFCGYVRSSAAGSEACKKSDSDAFAVCKRTGEAYVYSDGMRFSHHAAGALHRIYHAGADRQRAGGRF